MKSKLTTIPQLTLEHKQRSLVTSIQSPENAWDTLKKKKKEKLHQTLAGIPSTFEKLMKKRYLKNDQDIISECFRKFVVKLKPQMQTTSPQRLIKLPFHGLLLVVILILILLGVLLE